MAARILRNARRDVSNVQANALHGSPLTADSLRVRVATPQDAPAIVAIVNAAYRGDASGAHGWTSEHHLVSGARIDEDGLRALMARDGSVVLVAEGDGAIIVGCVHLQRVDDATCDLGLLSVDVRAQAQGVGRALLAAAEGTARETLGARRVAMRVISIRDDLLSWYERRGYARTGVLVPFVAHGGQRFLQGPLAFEVLEKRLDQPS